MQITKKGLLRILLFLAISVFLFQCVNCWFNPAEDVRNEKRSFYEEEKNSIDVIFCGSSSMLRAVMPTELYTEYGIAGYSLATVLQSPVLTAFSVKEALRTQSPKLIVLGMEWLEEDYDYAEYEAYVHSALDPYHISWNKVQAAWRIAQQDDSQSMLDYLFPVLRYHDAWHQEDAITPITQEVSYAKGYVGVRRSDEVAPDETYMRESGTEVTYSEKSLKYYREIAELCQKENIPLLVVKFPRMEWTLEEHEAMAAFAEELGADFIDFNEETWYEKDGISYDSDFCDAHHLSSTGAYKLTDALGAYIAEHYELPDARTDSRYAAWAQYAEDCTQQYNFCVHEYYDGETVSWKISSQTQQTSLRYRWNIYLNGCLLASEETDEPDFSVPVEQDGLYTANCSIMSGETVIRRVASEGVTIGAQESDTQS